jgi:hypothetical protein
VLKIIQKEYEGQPDPEEPKPKRQKTDKEEPKKLIFKAKIVEEEKVQFVVGDEPIHEKWVTSMKLK